MPDKKVIIIVPDSDMLSKANLKSVDLEKQIASMFGNTENLGVTHIVVKTGNEENAKAAGGGGISWERSC